MSCPRCPAGADVGYVRRLVGGVTVEPSRIELIRSRALRRYLANTLACSVRGLVVNERVRVSE